MSREDWNDPLYRESCPQRCSPPPGPLDGPTAAWMRAHPDNVSTLRPQRRTHATPSDSLSVTNSSHVDGSLTA